MAASSPEAVATEKTLRATQDETMKTLQKVCDETQKKMENVRKDMEKKMDKIVKDKKKTNPKEELEAGLQEASTLIRNMEKDADRILNEKWNEARTKIEKIYKQLVDKTGNQSLDEYVENITNLVSFSLKNLQEGVSEYSKAVIEKLQKTYEDVLKKNKLEGTDS
ncbi:hypothetical protein JTB14_038072 [Gonioctena quinquepunctata]|nr:hypothetical protein JTB14_038072 [Gonioctena quinquepunctata]